MRRNACLATILLALCHAAPAQACTLCSCTASTSGLNFGSYDASSSVPNDATGTVTLNCTGLVSLAGNITLTASPGNSGSAATRKMTRGSSILGYNLYTDINRTAVWGDGQGGTSTINSPLNGLLIFSQNATIYGRISTHQWAPVGTYSDTIVVTIEY
ncbi:MAG: spore coat protein U domain-containing protein [Sphingomonadales bacterium]|nr:spore coat protein U domain-containing protein [Sphingomonadales bacterium]MDE2168132.1 spore coat protein U domain-containing protein [Sphingomonadales bacterium]